MTREYIYKGNNLSAKIHKTDDVWFMYVTGMKKDHQFFTNTRKELLSIFEYLDKNPTKLEEMTQ